MHALLQWYLESGIDEVIGEAPVNRLAAPQAAPHRTPPSPTSTSLNPSPAPAMPKLSPATPPPQAILEARALADAATTFAELDAAVRRFEGCGLKKTATNTVFADGNPDAGLLVIGEAPGAQEDLQGIPFCGPSGQLLDRALASIGLDRTRLLISNTVYWRPPGNRTPTPEEMAMCEPFLQKLVALVKPRLMILAGGAAVTSVLKRPESMSRLRGRFYEYTNPYLSEPVKVAVTYHPSYLMRSPTQKRLAWADMMLIEKCLQENQ